MCPLSDDALLEWALAPREADPEIERHLRDCRACRERQQTREQARSETRQDRAGKEEFQRKEMNGRARTPSPETVRAAVRLSRAVAGGEPGRQRFGLAADGRRKSGVCPQPAPTAVQDDGATNQALLSSGPLAS